jgi:multimeric flavodoxin WrbA
MQKVKILGVGGSPRKNGNTTKMVLKALEGAGSVPGVETELYEMGGKKIGFCISCYKCLEMGYCVLKDDFHEFVPNIWRPTACYGAPPSITRPFPPR